MAVKRGVYCCNGDKACKRACQGGSLPGIEPAVLKNTDQRLKKTVVKLTTVLLRSPCSREQVMV